MKTHADKSKSASVKKQKKRLDRRWSVLPLLIAGCLDYGAALGNPVGPQVVSGQASMTSQGKLLTITNSSDAIINWKNFSIGADEATRFIQQSSSSAVLNRIVGQDPSQILGALQSNGRVFLINPNGILFGRGAQVDVNGLVASTLGIGNEDFLAGKLNFKAGVNPGTLGNQGAITTPTGGRVYLIAPHIENSGIITSPKGDVLLAAGQSVQLVDSSNPDLRVVVSAPDDQAINLGQVIAQGGRIGIYGALVNQRGTVNADSAVVGENGKIVFKASRDTLLETGSVTSATGAGKGGEIQILGDRVGLTGDAKVDASGLSGGGTVLVGGDYHGGNASIQNATQTFAGRDTAIKTDALQSGEGGRIIVWSNQATRAYGSLSARGGALGGHGGFVETSGHYLEVAGIAVDTSAPNGKLGSWLLDPYDIAVAAGGSAALADVSLFATPPSSGTSTIDPALISGASSDVALQATHDITFTDAVSIAAANVGLNARAGNNINVNNTITSNGGAILLFANDSGGPSTGTGTVTTAGAIASNGGGIGLSGHSLYIGNSVTSTNGMVDMKSDDFIAFHGGAVDAGAGNITLLAGTQIDVWSGSSLIANQLKMTAVDGITDGSGAAAFTRVSALNVGNSGAGDIRIDNSTGGNLSIIDIGGTGYGIQQASSGLVDILNLGGTISGSGVVSAGSLGLHATGGIALQTKVSSLSAINYTSGDISITNSVPLMLNDVKQLAEVGVNSGSIIIDNTGTLNVAGDATVSAASGGIALTAHSPLSVDGTVVTTSGAITLTAGATGVPGAGDTLTINGGVTSTSGNISLRAGDAINIAANAVVSTGGTVTQAANLNVPTIAQCTADPMLPGCSAVLPGLATCIADPATPGCTAVVPSLATCIASPTTAGCTVMLPSLTTCIASPTTAGCSVVLPTLTTCIASPTTAGCSVVLPTLTTCVATPTAAGCTVVLPTLTTCIASPATAGCTVVLPTLTTCIASPTTAGCTVVLPTLTTCVANAGAAGCTVVLPSLTTCLANPAAAGCAVVLPSLTTCVANPATAGCTAVLPPLAICIASPTTAGCAAVLPTVNQCFATPTAPGCEVVAPVTQMTTSELIARAINTTVNIINTSTAAVTSPAATDNTSAKSTPTADDKKDTVATDKSGVKNDDAVKKMYCN